MAAEAKTTDSKKEESKEGSEATKKVEEKSDAKKESKGDAAAATVTDAKKDDSTAGVAAGKEDKDGAATAKGDEEPAAAAAEGSEETTDTPAQSTEQDHRFRRVYVGNLAWSVSWQDLKDYMKSTGFEVNRSNIMMTPDGRSKGCGIVEFATVEGAQKAVETLNDTELSGRQIFVREDREDRGGNSGQRTQYGQNRGGSTQQASSGESKSSRVYVGNLSWDVAWQDLKDHMRQAGEVVHAEVISESNGRSKGCGIVEYSTAEEAQEAISTLTDTEIKGRMIFVREDRETSGGGGPGRGGGRYGGRGGGRGRGRGGRYRNYRPNPNYSPDQNNDGNGEESAGAGGCQLFVGQLSYDTTWRELKDHFRQCGDVERAEVHTNMNGRSKGFGTVRFYNKKDADSAIEKLNGVELQGRSLVVRIDNKAK